MLFNSNMNRDNGEVWDMKKTPPILGRSQFGKN